MQILLQEIRNLQSYRTIPKDFKSAKGFTQKDINKALEAADQIKKEVQAKKINKVLNLESTSLNGKNDSKTLASGSVAMAGAYDNYYNYDYGNSHFVAQALSESPHEYVRYTGNTSSNKNASIFNDFRNNIDQYEYYIIQQMNSPSWSEVGSFFIF
ncbi:hypothetical protein [Tuberibacillus sp. Marseille-P3662]|uniref:hypothetical protein n=1 Tax=Tuberibacillus sp. Marseille-P3662 TaxID=1965358 RepID=UPI00111C63FE|nr:hypothetical protein [Tuberibacillus sp. Marseille-P3662]